MHGNFRYVQIDTRKFQFSLSFDGSITIIIAINSYFDNCIVNYT